MIIFASIVSAMYRPTEHKQHKKKKKHKQKTIWTMCRSLAASPNWTHLNDINHSDGSFINANKSARQDLSVSSLVLQSIVLHLWTFSMHSNFSFVVVILFNKIKTKKKNLLTQTHKHEHRPFVWHELSVSLCTVSMSWISFYYCESFLISMKNKITKSKGKTATMPTIFIQTYWI